MLGAAGAGGHLLEVIEVDVIHQLLAGLAGRIHATRCFFIAALCRYDKETTPFEVKNYLF
ncbi:hypothetical protein ACLUZS_34030 [Pseudomonas aeruginosa]|uniref:hypothetical protein n=1 Tax=Pseudomonas aeruginosa TaxID=287 RepID=UPI00399630F5